ncbi:MULTISPECIES: nuclear transport factor 2 family protein [unclassified Microbacterium]|uniref:nuclear transport factor 2 family protein n=1 Tax=unclassified Microbacterium TaxID=2609290 RepID=UPI000D5756B4|nr:nuclear transport factor 2 family protein [Microbacterium sp. Gd 4-13]PVW06849.1 nuclear transport factor 2 family protein [Microbacterium sp. Gd 4-13]
MTDIFTAYDPETVPSPAVAYLDARDENRHADAAAMFAPDATVIDDGKTYEGIDAITTWIERSSTEYAYTSTRIGQQIADETHPVVRVRLDGNFPGGTVTLRYEFDLRGESISRLVIDV